MSGNDNALVPRPGPAPRLLQGPQAGQRSLYHQRVLDEDTYTEALSTIITRDFFPNLPHIHATNDYLTALTNNDPELLSSSIRKLAAIAQAKEGNRPTGDDARLRELENVGTPYMNVPGRRAAARTPVGARGWDTPVEASRRGHAADDDDYDELDGQPGPSNRPLKRPRKTIRDDLPLDAFQANYTSEDNASFVQIVDEENKRRQEERWAWAWEAEQRAEQRRIAGEEKRKMILDAATSGQWAVDGNGKRLIGGLAEPGRDRSEGEAWKDPKLLTAPPIDAISAADDSTTEEASGAMIKATDLSTDGALVKHTEKGPKPGLTEQPVPDGHPLQRALVEAGLPATALVSAEDGAIVPHREVTSGDGQGRGRGDDERDQRSQLERSVMGEERQEALSLGGSGVDQWKYKAMNNFMFPADANTKPYPPPGGRPLGEPSRGGPKIIRHANTSFPEQDEPSSSRAGSSRRGTSPSRSLVQAAVAGTPYRPNDGITVNNYPLLPQDASPSPSDMPSLLTWGTLLATPRALDGSDDPLDGPSFRLPDSNRRDEIGRKLGDKASRSMNERAKGFTPRPSNSNSALRALAGRTQRPGRGERTPGGMAPPSSATPQRRENLTPAGKRLLERSMGIGARNRGAVMEKTTGWGKNSSGTSGLSWTPSPGHRRS